MTLKEQRQLNRPKGVTLENLSQYIITDSGTVWTDVKDRYLKGMTKEHGYKMVFLKDDNGKGRWYYVHRLVAMAYIPNPENKPCVDHIDKDPSNNHVSNLRWCTHKENIGYAVESGSFDNMPRGTSHYNQGKRASTETRAKMSAKKTGENHPKFKGYYKYDNKLFTSCQQLADYLGTYAMKVYKMYKKGLIEFLPISQLEPA